MRSEESGLCGGCKRSPRGCQIIVGVRGVNIFKLKKIIPNKREMVVLLARDEGGKQPPKNDKSRLYEGLIAQTQTKTVDKGLNKN